MNKWRKLTAVMLVLALVLSMAACGGDTTSSTASTASDTSATSSTADDTSDTGSETSETADDTSSTAETEGTGADMTSYPREESLYQSGQQWATPVSNNPMAANSNFAAMGQNDTGARELVWETLYMYNVADGKNYPLLADGDWQWNEDQTVLTVKLKEVAHWSDGTPFTAADVEATWDAHVNYESTTGVAYSPYVADVVAVDDYTVEFQVNTENKNLMKFLELPPKMYIMQKAYLDSLIESTGGDATAMKNELMWDAPTTAPYRVLEHNDQKWVLERDDNYWGQDESMWGKLPVPRYIIHNIYSSNDVAIQAQQAGEVDVSQTYTANVESLWEDQGLPISTYMENPPYNDAGVIPTVLFNVQRPGLDQVEVRKAIAMATDYDQIIESAMTGQSPTFDEYPRSLFTGPKLSRA